MKTIYSTLIFSLLFTPLMGNLHKADRLFDQWEYSRAVVIYEKNVERHPVAQTYYKIGECYRHMNRYLQAEAAYSKVDAAELDNPIFHLHYGEILQNNGKNAEAKAEFDKYDVASPGNSIARFHRESMDIVTEDHKWDEPIVIKNVTALNSSSSDFSPVFYKDGMVFASSRIIPSKQLNYPWTGTPYLDLYVAGKGSTGTDYGNVQLFDHELNQKFHDGPATFSSDFNTMYFSRVEKSLKGKENRAHDIERCKIFKSVYEDGRWSEPEAFAYNSNSHSVGNPYLSRDGSRLYFSSDMSGGYGATDIYYCELQSNGDWGQPVNMGASVNTFNEEKFPNEDLAGNFYFASNGFHGFGGLDICVALKKGGSLQKAIPMKYPFNSTYDDFGIVFLNDERTGYITSNRYDGGMGDDDIYHFDLNADEVPAELVTSVYTIGYRPAEKPIVALDPRDSTLDATPGNFAVYHGAIYFDFDKSDLRPASKQTLDTIADYMKANPGKMLVISGHCDVRGTSEYNQKLSERRNAATIDYLSANGIPKNRIRATAYGFKKLANDCTKEVSCPEDKHQKNRRVEYGFE